ncbi:hypothetical protein CAPTEDRAFT_190676 [Capitella teleta]|uniref:G-protein coupled receptors family 1 profile domain-containing protein n=1 Tax=Capitella teleta TaxID=283909 RepID=R7T5X9_CAPTE|nr:hypothetical protein CAPTEDRAFT_190676 [Capitella teleta]|eukprot:ELT88864.1 hypothetical protein CAPTEDRAFT_190676 [Capitella teleta]
MSAFRSLWLISTPILAIVLTASGESVPWEASTAGQTQVIWEATEPAQDKGQKGSNDDIFEKIYLKKIGTMIKSYGHVTLGTLALICNILTLIVLREQKSLSPFVYMKWIAACDFLIGLMITCSGVMVNRDFLRSHSALREFTYWIQMPVYFLQSTFTSGAIYIAAALGMDRLIAVRYPLKRVIWCTTRRAHITSAILVMVGVIPNIQLVLRLESALFPDRTSGIMIPYFTYTQLGRDPTVTAFVQYSKFILKQVIPLVVMSVTGTWTVVIIFKSRRFQKQANIQKTGNNLQCFGVTIGVIVLFIVTNITQAIFALDTSINGSNSMTFKSYSFSVSIIRDLTKLLPWANASLNFVVYLLFNDTFRQTAIRLFCCRMKNRRNMPLSPTDTFEGMSLMSILAFAFVYCSCEYSK